MDEKELIYRIEESKRILKEQTWLLSVTKKGMERDLRLFENELKKRRTPLN